MDWGEGPLEDDPELIEAAELARARRAHPDKLVVRVRRYQAGHQVVAVPKGRRPEADAQLTQILAICALFEVDEIRVGFPREEPKP